jgi:hypothetical protein
MSRTRGLVTLLACLTLWLACVATPVPALAPRANGGSGDVFMYQTMLSRLRAGEEYYDVVGGELRRGHYALVPAFNWRTPLLLSFLARVPDAVGRGLLGLLGVTLLMATVAMTVRRPLWALGSGIMQIGAMATWIVPSAVVLGEVWAGVLIALSVCLYASKRTTAAVAFGLAALFLRELAAPYCVACAIYAMATRRWREVAAWLGGAAVYAVYFGWHVVQVAAHELPADHARTSSWLVLGGLGSLLIKARWQAWLLFSPPWATAFALTVIAAGIGAAKAPGHVRIASLAFGGFFLVAGMPMNQYWGLIAWPTWALACGYGVQLISDAARAVVARS